MSDADIPGAKHQPRIFLVVVDESPELAVALRYACLRARNSHGRIALLHVLEPDEVQHFLTVDTLIREERRQEAEQRLQKLAREVNQLTGTLPVLVLREGNRRDELLKLIDEDPKISILVLAAGTGSEGPGPLIAYLTGRGINRLRIPLTIVPGGLSDEQLAAIT
jgi:nucleotide-binding universal stress UspA family protein